MVKICTSRIIRVMHSRRRSGASRTFCQSIVVVHTKVELVVCMLVSPTIEMSMCIDPKNWGGVPFGCSTTVMQMMHQQNGAGKRLKLLAWPSAKSAKPCPHAPTSLPYSTEERSKKSTRHRRCYRWLKKVQHCRYGLLRDIVFYAHRKTRSPRKWEFATRADFGDSVVWFSNDWTWTSFDPFCGQCSGCQCHESIRRSWCG